MEENQTQVQENSYRKKILAASHQRRRKIVIALSALGITLAVTQSMQFFQQPQDLEKIALVEPSISETKIVAAADHFGDNQGHALYASLIAALKEQGQWQEDQINSLNQEILTKNLRIEEIEQKHDSQEQDKERLGVENSKLQLLQKELASLQEKYKEEQSMRLAKEVLLVETLQSQKQALHEIEQARLDLTKELASAKQHYFEHLNEISYVAKNLPISSPANPKPLVAERIHQVSKGETLSGISLQYYGTAKRWEEIYQANKAVIINKNQIKAGTTLVIP